MAENVVKGAFVDSLVRTNKQIRGDRATIIHEDTEISYRREIEDLTMKIRNLNRDQSNMLDLSPDNSFSLKLAANFDSKAYAKSDIEIEKQKRNLEIELDLAQKRYRYLFTEDKETE